MAQNIIVDIRTRGHNPVAYTHQGDTNRTFVFEIYENGEAFSLSGYTAKIGAVLPSDNGYYVISGSGMVTGTIATNKITATLTADYSRKAGNGFLTIILTNSSGSLRPINIDYRIQESSDGDDVIAGASDFPETLADMVDDWLSENEPTEIANIKGDIKNLTNIYEQKIYSRYFMQNLTANKVLQTSTGDVVAGGANNFVFDYFLPIPRGTLYFAFPNTYGYNCVFYDSDYEVVDTLYVDNNMSTLYGKSYENTGADYVKIGGYHEGGFSEDISKCFIYQYNSVDLPNKVVPLYRNQSLMWDEVYRTQIASDYILADTDLVVSCGVSDVKFGLVFYDEDHNVLENFYANDIIGYSISVPKGSIIKLYVKASNDGNVTCTDYVVNSVTIKKAHSGLGPFTFSGNSDHLVEATSRIGNISPFFSETDMILTCENFGTVKYNVALYDENTYNQYPKLMCYGDTESFFIPKGFYYRYCVGIDGETAKEEHAKYITIKPISENTPEIGAAISETFKNRSRLADAAPSYYASHLSTKAATVNNLKNTNAIQFLFVTDYHQGTYDNAHTFRSVATDLIKKTNVNMIFNGGDTWTSGTSQASMETARTRLIDGVNNTIPDTACDWFFVLGNHDTGLDYLVQGDNVTTFGPYFSTKEFQYLMGGNLTGNTVKYDPNGTDMCYYFDKDAFRFIVLNNDLATEGADENQYNTLKFLSKALLSADGKTVIIVMHKICNSSGEYYNSAGLVKNMVVAYNARGTYQLATNQIARFDDCTGEVACLIGGHLHEDYDTELSDGTPVILTTSTNAGAGEDTGETRTRGTYLENAFDVFTVNKSSKTINATRIGAGSDRSFSYQ